MESPFDRIYEGEYYKTREGEILKSFLVYNPNVVNTIYNSDVDLTENRKKKISRYLQEWFDEVEKTKTERLTYGVVFYYKGGL